MCSQFTAITAGDLLVNQKFAFEDTRNATVFYALGIAHAVTDTVITLSHGIQFIMPSRNALYLVTEPEQISVTLLRPGDRYLINSSEVFTAHTVDDGADLDSRLPRGEWIDVGIGDDSYHSFSAGRYVYRLPALSPVTPEPEIDRYHYPYEGGDK